jgi:hypothetical protein
MSSCSCPSMFSDIQSYIYVIQSGLWARMILI